MSSVPAIPEGQPPLVPFEFVLDALRQGDNAVWSDLFARYSHRLIGLARSRLGEGRLRQKLDPADVVQSVYRTFYRRLHDGQFVFSSWDSLWGLLLVLTVRRVHRWREHFASQKRQLDREATLPPAAEDSTESPPSFREPIDRNPTPEEAALLVEVVQETCRGLDEVQRRVILNGLLGLDDVESSTAVGRSEYRINQMRKDYLRHLRKRLEEGG